MIVDKALLVKGAAGVAAVGGIATTGGIVFKDQIRGAFSNSSGENEGNGGGTQQNAVTQDSQITEDSRNNGKGSKVTIDQPSKLGPGATGDQAPRADEGVTGSQSAKEIQSRSGNPQGGGGSADPSGPTPSVKTDEEKKGEKKEAVNAELKKLGLSNCLLEDKDITEPTTFSKECVLDETKFKAINFSNKGTGTVTVSGWSSNITLKIENKNDNKVKYTFKGVTSKLTIVGAKGNGVITLPKSEEREFEEKSGKLSKISKNNTQEESKLKVLNQKLKGIKIPERCWFDESEKDESIECDLSNKTDELKKIEFSNKEWEKDSVINDSTNGLKLTINKLSDEEGAKKYSSGINLEFIFGNHTSEIKIQDNRTSKATADIVLKTNTNSILTISQDTTDSNRNKLFKSFLINNFSAKLGLSCTSTHVPCTPSGSDTKIRIFTDDTNLEEVTVQTSQENDQIMCVSENANGFEQGFKYTAKKSFLTTSSKLQENANYQAKYVTGKGWGLSKKS